MTKHTPEPWSVSSDRYIVGPDLELIADCYNESPTDAINARLIAAAPNLLAALKECVTETGAARERSHEYAERRIQYINATARAAIAKTTGTPP